VDDLILKRRRFVLVVTYRSRRRARRAPDREDVEAARTRVSSSPATVLRPESPGASYAIQGVPSALVPLGMIVQIADDVEGGIVDARSVSTTAS